MNQSTFTFRVDDKLKDRFTKAAKSLDRSGAQLIGDFMRDFVQNQKNAKQYDAWFHQQVQLGIQIADAGKVISAADVEAEAASWRKQQQKNIKHKKS